MAKSIKTRDKSPESNTALGRNKRKLGVWLRARREEIHRSLRQAADEGDCSDAWLCQIENATCDVAAVQVASLPKLARAYNLPITTLLDAILRASGTGNA